MKPFICLAICFTVLCFFARCQHMDVSKDDIGPFQSIEEKYTKGWLSNTPETVLDLFTPDARIQPSSLCPIDSLHNIKKFWFPGDGSVTIIDSFTTELLHVKVMDTLAVSTKKDYLEWTYINGSTRFGRKQKGIVTTLYKKRGNDWKIWRQMWTDYEVKKY